MKLRCQGTSNKSVSSSRTALVAQTAGATPLRISARYALQRVDRLCSPLGETSKCSVRGLARANCIVACRLRAGPLPNSRRFHLHSGSKSSGQKLKLTCNSVNTSNGNGNGTSSNGSFAVETTSDVMETADMGGSDPNVIKELQQANENPFPESHFDGKSDDPLENLKNQVRRLQI